MNLGYGGPMRPGYPSRDYERYGRSTRIKSIVSNSLLILVAMAVWALIIINPGEQIHLFWKIVFGFFASIALYGLWNVFKAQLKNRKGRKMMKKKGQKQKKGQEQEKRKRRRKIKRKGRGKRR